MRRPRCAQHHPRVGAHASSGAALGGRRPATTSFWVWCVLGHVWLSTPAAALTPSQPAPRQRTVAVDYGLKRVGVGVGAGWACRPLRVLDHEDRDETAVARDLLAIARAESATGFVVGLPLDHTGAEGAQANLTRHFARGGVAMTSFL